MILSRFYLRKVFLRKLHDSGSGFFPVTYPNDRCSESRTAFTTLRSLSAFIQMIVAFFFGLPFFFFSRQPLLLS